MKKIITTKLDTSVADLQKIIDQGNKILEELGKGKEVVADALRQKWEETTEAAKERMIQAKEYAAEKGTEVYQFGQVQLEKSRQFTAENPVKTVTCALAAGFVIGMYYKFKRS